MSHIYNCSVLARMLEIATERSFSGGLMNTILDNLALPNPDPLLILLHARVIAALYEVHNYKRSNNTYFTSIEDGAKTFGRILCDINIRKRRRKKKSK